ncbi:MAG: type restriction enzyme, partial [Bacteroidota bacterium]
MSGLSQYFTGIATKRLSAVETDPATSNQHEFNGTRPMVSIFGTGETRQKVDCTFMYFDDDEEKTTTSNGFLTWYDSRANQPHRSAEYRLYFNDNTAIELAKPGDLLLIGKRPDGSTLALIVKKDTTVERQVLWLFGIEENNDRFVVSTFQGEANRQIGFAERTILETLGIEIKPEGDVKWIDILLEKYGPAFPSTRAFSEFA